MSKRFDNKSVLITGAASGMGQATALRVASEGARVCCADVDSEGLEKTVEQIQQNGGKAFAAQADITSAEQCRELIDRVASDNNGLDVLFNIAGLGGTKATEEETDERWRLVMDVNINGPFFLSQAAIPHLLKTKGNILNVASTAGLVGHAYMAAYTASKHALVGLTKALALEYGRKGLRVNAICPGGTKTKFVESFEWSDHFDASLVTRVGLLDEFAEADDVANAICFIASDEAKFINGALVSVDGGATAG